MFFYPKEKTEIGIHYPERTETKCSIQSHVGRSKERLIPGEPGAAAYFTKLGLSDLWSLKVSIIVHFDSPIFTTPLLGETELVVTCL